MHESLELTRFTVHPGAEAAFLSGRDAAMRALSKRFPGLLDATLVRLSSGEYLDSVRWASHDEAQHAMEGAMALPEVAAWFIHISEVHSMEHASVLHVLREVR
ncbi:hypothetical protein DEDE109153_14950 [Deinococcus deserti]|uniref:ABM domain-containing protein n=1 Tax=Deinococcus deserti (strain DSM 17065 / CIP 109153 / LMG 22923 / VCD115) TaxID=546414 RepID=X5H5S8_DEIDV|nr:hypothetical protein [Deinococcus deserti]AHX26538.1 hypothetical protein Deide_23145 [Deinococcus deserti VCD115]